MGRAPAALTIAQLDVVGFDTTVPAVIADFVRN
jgi:hypothetical protein